MGRPAAGPGATGLRRRLRARGGGVGGARRWSVLAQVLVEWKATAAVYADPALVEELTRSLEADLEPVPAPDWA